MKWILQLVRCNSSPRKPRDPKFIWEDSISSIICSPDIIADYKTSPNFPPAWVMSEWIVTEFKFGGELFLKT